LKKKCWKFFTTTVIYLSSSQFLSLIMKLMFKVGLGLTMAQIQSLQTLDISPASSRPPRSAIYDNLIVVEEISQRNKCQSPTTSAASHPPPSDLVQ
jgi:hypothetical protein